MTDVGSISEVVDDGITGFIIPPKDSESLAKTVSTILNNSDLRKQMGENSYKKMKEELSWEKISKKSIEIYKKAIK